VEGKSAPNRIRELRNKVGISQKKLAMSIGISDTALQNYEYQKRKLPADVLSRLASFFDVSTDYILMATDDPKRYSAAESVGYVQESDRFLLLDAEEMEIIDCYRTIKAWERKMVLEQIRAFVAHEESFEDVPAGRELLMSGALDME